MGMRRTVSFKGTDGIRSMNGGNFTGRKISTNWGSPGTGQTARPKTTKTNTRRNSFGHQRTGETLQPQNRLMQPRDRTGRRLGQPQDPPPRISLSSKEPIGQNRDPIK